MLKFTFLTKEFYADYSSCKEIERKEHRPHIQLTIDVNGVLFCIPMRSNINHPHVLWTDKKNKCGIDFSKAVVITDRDRYLDHLNKPFIRQNEFDSLRGKEHIIEQKMIKYIRDYKMAKANLSIARNRMLVMCSTLQYFEEYL